MILYYETRVPAEAFMSAQRTLKFASAVLLCALASPAFASNRDMVQLQTQVQQLQDAVARLQQSNDERMGVMKDLIQQSSDSVNRMSQNMDVIQKQLADAHTAQGAKSDQLSGQIQALNDSIDEMRTRMTHLEKLLTTVESEQQTLASGVQSPAGAAQSTGAPAPTASASSPTNEGLGGPVQAPIATNQPAAADAPPVAPPVGDLYKTAYRDYMAAHYPVANSEFNDVIKAYPDNNLAGNAWFFLGEMEYRAGKYAVAARAAPERCRNSSVAHIDSALSGVAGSNAGTYSVARHVCPGKAALITQCFEVAFERDLLWFCERNERQARTPSKVSVQIAPMLGCRNPLRTFHAL